MENKDRIAELEKELADLKSKKIDKPLPLSHPEFEKLEKMVQDYMTERFGEDWHGDNDWEEYIFEEAIEAFYGKDIWKKLNDSL